MTVYAGYLTNLKVSATTDSGYQVVGQCKSISGFGCERAKIDTSAFGGAGAETVAGGIQKATVTLNCLADGSDAGQSILNTAYSNRSAVWLEGLWDGTNGDNVECKCLKKTYTPDLAGGWMVAYEMTMSGLIDQTIH
ncbi:MAG: hypothetical protein WC642_11165 [Nocardioides sp.]|jgi:hypothetical protein